MTTAPIMITLNQIKARSPCESGWRKLLKAKGKTDADDVPFPMADILDSNGFDDCLWAMRCLPEHNRLWILYVVWCAREVRHLMTDNCSIDALDVAERFANGQATQDEMKAASAAAFAARAASAAAFATRAADSAAFAAARAAAFATRAADSAAYAAARAAADSAAAFAAAAFAAARAKQEAKLRELLTTGEFV